MRIPTAGYPGGLRIEDLMKVEEPFIILGKRRSGGVLKPFVSKNLVILLKTCMRVV